MKFSHDAGPRLKVGQLSTKTYSEKNHRLRWTRAPSIESEAIYAHCSRAARRKKRRKTRMEPHAAWALCRGSKVMIKLRSDDLLAVSCKHVHM